METNTITKRFKVGHSYTLRTSPDFPRLLGGTMTVTAELKPTDNWGNRIILADLYLTDSNGTPLPDGTRLGCRAFVEEGVMSFSDSLGNRTIPVEIAALQGCYPNFAKAYAIDECMAAQQPSTASVSTAA